MTERPAHAIPPFCSAEFEPTSLSWYSGQLEISSRSHNSHRSSPGPPPWDRINTPAYRSALRRLWYFGQALPGKADLVADLPFIFDKARSQSGRLPHLRNM